MKKAVGPFLRNWAKNITFSTTNVVYPKTVADVVAVVTEHQHVKTVGSRHSFNVIADTYDTDTSVLVSPCEHLNKVVDIDRKANTVTVEAGITYGDLCPILESNNLALENLASLPHISVAGSVATATHGSGLNNTNLSDAVVGIELVTASGEVVNYDLSSNMDVTNPLNGAVVSYGALGVVTKLKLRVVPSFQCRQVVFHNISGAEVSF